MMIKRTKEKLYPVLLILFAVIFSVPQFMESGIPYYGHDTIFHLTRLTGFSNVLTSPVNYFLVHTGSLVNIFYPWLTMYPMWLFYKLTGSYVTGYNVYILVLSIITALISYVYVRAMTKSSDSAFCCSMIYTFSSYRFMDIYLRTAMGEAISMAFLPVVIYGIWLILYDDHKKWQILSIGMAMIAYSHLLSLYLTSIILVLMILLSLKNINEKASRALSFIKSVILAVLLSAGFLLPLLSNMIRQKLYRPDGSSELFSANACDLLYYFRNSLFNYFTPYSIGLLILTVMIADLVIIIKNKKKCGSFTLLITVIGVCFLFIVSLMVPWNRLAVFPFIRLIQFQWRLLLYTTLFISVSFGILMTYIKNGKVRISIVIFTPVFCLMVFILSIYRFKDEEPFYMVTDDFLNSDLIVDSNDYTPIELYEYREANNFEYLYLYHGGEMITPYIADNGNALFFYIPNIKTGEEIELPVCNFAYTKVMLNGNEVKTTSSSRGTIIISSDSDSDAEIIVTNRYDAITYLSWLISLISAVLTAVYFFKRIRYRDYNNQHND